MCVLHSSGLVFCSDDGAVLVQALALRCPLFRFHFFSARRFVRAGILSSVQLSSARSVLLIINLAPCPHFFIVFCSWRSVFFALCSIPSFCSILHQHYYAAAVFVRCCFLFYAAPYFLISAVFCSLAVLFSVFFSLDFFCFNIPPVLFYY